MATPTTAQTASGRLPWPVEGSAGAPFGPLVPWPAVAGLAPARTIEGPMLAAGTGLGSAAPKERK